MKKIFEDYCNIDIYMEIKENIIKNFIIDIKKNSQKLISQRLENLIKNNKGPT